jgi:hypothetical protein
MREMMISASLKTALKKELPILFAYVGWANYYDGTEPIRGNFEWLKRNPKRNWEANAFSKEDDGHFYCGVGRGILPSISQLHVVLVARDPIDGELKVVGLYAAAALVGSDAWPQARTKNAVRFPIGTRPSVSGWPVGQGTRRWASRGGSRGNEHRSLRRFFDQLKSSIIKERHFAHKTSSPEPMDVELQAFEGQAKFLFVKHRQREARLRHEKLREAFKQNGGHLLCEVPKCKFDFMKRYGQLGAGYAQVHHKRPLAAAPKKGQRTKLKDLAVVCANCHAMIHKGGACRPLKALIP